MRLQKLRETYKGPSGNNLDILQHFYGLQQECLSRLSRIDVNEFAMKLCNLKLVRKSFGVLKKRAFQKSKLARDYYLLQRKFKLLRHWKAITRPRLEAKRIDQHIHDIYRLFQTRRVLRGWKQLTLESAKIHTIGEARKQHTFCARYSDYCKCVRCRY